MYDYWRLRICDKEQIQVILKNPLFNFKMFYDKNTSELHSYPQIAKWKNWDIEVSSATNLLITGSIHKFYNGGTNESNFTFKDSLNAINQFCSVFNLRPELAQIQNLEFGVNIRPLMSASKIIEQVICYKNTRPLRPYEGRQDYFFIEFSIGDYYVKMYDKGKQYKTENILRFEIKAAKNRYLAFAEITTLKDLTKLKTMQLLGVKINQVLKDVIFNDPTISIATLSKADRNNYLLMKDANEWAINKKNKTSTHRNRENRFKGIVAKYGKTQSKQEVTQKISHMIKHMCNI